MADESFWISPSFLSGRAFCDSVFDRALICGHYNPHMMDLLSLMITRETILEQEKQSWFMSINVPAPYVNKTFLDFFCFSTLFSVVPVALYRSEPATPQYTYTNPLPQTILTQYDKLMVLVPYILISKQDHYEHLITGDVEWGKKYCERNSKTNPDIILMNDLHEKQKRNKGDKETDTLVDVVPGSDQYIQLEYLDK
eukprot:TRINITY_DN6330_c0_g1_i1.p1 TRINITY_DN6330_c0_g1~~TRINITY_DN6330_c0_g1_i1.p1  ORF type:complete len:225 (+),score=35.43 TRINITY_DN6330_c0_g1_i1:87-677(+)